MTLQAPMYLDTPTAMSVEFLDRCAPFLERYRVIVCDVWGVLYDGVTAYPAAVELLRTARNRGCLVILLSNAARLPVETATMLGRAGIAADCYDGLVTSGQLAVEVLSAERVRKVFHIGPDRHAGITAAAGSSRVEPDDAEAIVCTGFFRDEFVPPMTYRPLLERLRERGLPMICANPDLVVEVGDEMLPCPGALARIYSDLGGTVYLAGKPDVRAYDAVRALAAGLAGAELQRSAFLAVGDSMATDMRGAIGAGMDALFVAGGIHRAEVVQGGEISREATLGLFEREGVSPTAVCCRLA